MHDGHQRVLPIGRFVTMHGHATRRYRWRDLMDVNAGRIAGRQRHDRRIGLGAVSPDARRGQRPQEDLGEHWKLRKALVLFNAGPMDLKVGRPLLVALAFSYNGP